MKIRRLARILISILMVTILLPLSAVSAESSQQMRVPRVISVVYDDSTSMDDPDQSDIYTMYAMNIFTSLLNENDVLYVTMMSKPDYSVRIDLSKGAETACNQLNNLFRGGATPLKAVKTAEEALKKHKSDYSSSLYWLVIFTDGAFDLSGIENNLAEFLDTKMPNGTTPQICYMGIGSSAEVCKIQNPDYTLYPKTGTIASTDGIVQALRDMADDISGRSEVDEQNIHISGNQMKVNIALPAYSIIVLQLRSGQPIKSIKDSNGNPVSYTTNHVLAHKPEYLNTSVYTTKNPSNLTLEGVTTILTPTGSEPLAEGTYTIEFAESPKDVVVLTEPALTLELEVAAVDTGKTDDFSLLSCGTANIQASLRLWNDPNPISKALLPADTQYSTRLEQNGQTIAEDKSDVMRLENVNIKDCDSEVIAEVDLPGIGRVYARQSIKLPAITLTADKQKVTSSLTEFCEGMDGFTVKFESDQELGAALAADANLLLETELPLKARANADNSYTIYCENNTLAPMNRYGDYSIVVTSDSNLKIDPLELVWHVKEPQFSLTGGISGLDRMSRLDMWKQQESALALSSMTDLSSLVPDEKIFATFQLSMDGTVLSKEHLDAFGGIAVDYSGSACDGYPLAQTLLEDGTLIILPYGSRLDFINPAMWNWLNSWKGATGEGIITCSSELTGQAVKASFYVSLEEIYLMLLNILLPILLIILIIGYSVKRRFPKNSYIVIQKLNASSSGVSSSEMGTSVKLRTLNFWSFVPFVRARTSVANTPVYAMSKTAVGIKKSVLPLNSYLVSTKTASQHGIVSVSDADASVRKVFHSEDTTGEGTLLPLTTVDVLVRSADVRGGTSMTLTIR